ncbi:hypothetical protein JCM15831A_19310 [Asaia astilbis]
MVVTSPGRSTFRKMSTQTCEKTHLTQATDYDWLCLPSSKMPLPSISSCWRSITQIRLTARDWLVTVIGVERID